jgi:hypothetical protein
MGKTSLILCCVVLIACISGNQALPSDLAALMKANRVAWQAKRDQAVYYDPNDGNNLVDPSLSRLMKKNTLLPKSKRPDFMGNSVSLPQYNRLMSLQRETIKMDRVMKDLARVYTPQQLLRDPSWKELMLIYRAMAKFLPEEDQNKEKELVWWL